MLKRFNLLILLIIFISLSRFVSALDADETPDGYTIDCSVAGYKFCDTFEDGVVNWNKWTSTDQAKVSESEGHTVLEAAGDHDGFFSQRVINSTLYNWTAIYKFSIDL